MKARGVVGLHLGPGMSAGQRSNPGSHRVWDLTDKCLRIVADICALQEHTEEPQPSAETTEGGLLPRRSGRNSTMDALAPEDTEPETSVEDTMGVQGSSQPPVNRSIRTGVGWYSMRTTLQTRTRVD